MLDLTIARLLDNSLLIPGAILGFVVHELAHALLAYWSGDHSSEMRQRFTINPLRHIPLVGLPLFLLFGFAWARPLRLNTAALARPHRGLLLTALAGPLANLALALILYGTSLVSLAAALVALPEDALRGPVFRFYFGGGTPVVVSALVGVVTFRAAQANLALALVNIVPLPPFDGFWALYAVWRWLRRRGATAAAPAAGPAAVRDARATPRAVSAGSLFHEGAMLQAGRKWAQAAEVYQRVLAQNPRERRAAYALGQVYERTGNRSEAARAYGRAYLLSADESERHQAAERLAELQVALADALAAQPAFTAAGPSAADAPQPRTTSIPSIPSMLSVPSMPAGVLTLRPRWQWAAVALGTLLITSVLYLGVFPNLAIRHTGATAFLEELHAAQAAFAAHDAPAGEAALRAALALAGDAYAQAGDPDARTRAATTITAIAAAAPASSAATVLRALVDLDAGDAGAALSRLKALPDQDDFFVKFYEASAYIETADWEPAQQALLDALTVRPDDPAAHSNLAFVYAQLGRLEQAGAEADRAIQLDPTLGHGWKNRSLAYLDDPSGSQADLAYGAAVVATLYAPGLASAHEVLSRALLSAGQATWAADEMREAQRLRDAPYSPYY